MPLVQPVKRCTATSRIIIHKKRYEEFKEIFLAKVKALKLGSGLDPKVGVGPVINKSQLKSINEYVEIGQKEGAKLLYGGKIITRRIRKRLLPRTDHICRC